MSRSELQQESIDRRNGPSWVLQSREKLAPQLARRVVVVVLSAISFVGMLNALSDKPNPLEVIYCLLSVAAVLAMQLRFFSRRVLEFPSRAGYQALAIEAILVYLPFLAFGQAWVGIPGFLAGSVLLALDGRRAWWTWGAVVASVGVLQAVFDPNPGLILYSVISTVITGLVVYALCWLASVVQQLHLARAEIAAMAVAHERVRFARDLHDLLGYSLSAITLKSELTRHLAGHGNPRVLAELDEILELSRQALSDVRSIATGYRNMSLQTESQSVMSVLCAADIAVTMNMDPVELPGPISTVLATVLREGVTNVLRHSDARNCHIEFSQIGPIAQLRLANDGVVSATDAPPVPATGGGSGIDSLSARVADLGGSLSSSFEDAGWFVLCAEVPLTQAAVKA
jgi:two-component system sensor histidine kinase DesK